MFPNSLAPIWATCWCQRDGFIFYQETLKQAQILELDTVTTCK